MITLGSLFDGIGGWQLAAVKNGVIKPLWRVRSIHFLQALRKRTSLTPSS